MSLRPQVVYLVPEETARVARAAFPKGNIYMRMHDERGMFYEDLRFAPLFSTSGQPAEAPARHRDPQTGLGTTIEFLARLLEDEVERRAQKQLTVRLRRATVNTTKTLEGFDFSFNPSLNRQQILQLASCDYIRRHRNVLICGLSGVGKSHLGQALGHEACRQGFDVLFTNTHKMLQHIHGGRADGSVERRLATYVRPDLLILDDFGLKPLASPAPEDLYDVIKPCYPYYEVPFSLPTTVGAQGGHLPVVYAWGAMISSCYQDHLSAYAVH